MMRSLFIVSVLFCLGCVGVMAVEGHSNLQSMVERLPSPAEHSSFVCDPSRTLNVEQHAAVDRLIDDIEKNIQDTGCDGKGFQLAIVILTRGEDPRGSVSNGDKAVELARMLMNDWGVGHSGCNNGIVLVLALGTRKFGIFSSFAARDLLSDAVQDAILDRMKQPLRAGNTYLAIAQSVTDFGDALAGNAANFMPTFS